jgi:hypothetical protein
VCWSGTAAWRAGKDAFNELLRASPCLREADPAVEIVRLDHKCKADMILLGRTA